MFICLNFKVFGHFFHFFGEVLPLGFGDLTLGRGLVERVLDGRLVLLLVFLSRLGSYILSHLGVIFSNIANYSYDKDKR
jgi:hypothetical protein